MTTVEAPSPEAFRRQMGRVYHQPIDLESYTNKRVTVNYRAPVRDLERLLPWCVDVDERPPDLTAFEDVDAAADYVLELDGSCNYNYGKGKLSYQDVEYPDWDVRFCHELSDDFPLLDYVFEMYDIDAEFDCALYMEDVEQTWGRSWLYEPEVDRDGTVGQSTLVAGD